MSRSACRCGSARSGDIARIAKSTGHDFIFIDCQHSLFNLETIGHIASTAMACGIAPLVRVRGIDDPDVSLLLDNGAMGIVYPDINTAAQAQRAVDSLQVRADRQALGERRLSAFRLSLGAADDERAAAQRQLPAGLHDRDRSRG